MIANYCLIKQNLASLVADSSDDSDRYPDVAQISGQVTFTPTTPQGQTYKITGEDGKLYTVPVTAITARIEDGKIMHEGEEGVYVFAGGEASNPRKVVYRASYSGLRAGGRGGVISLNAVTFEAIPGGEIDLTTVTPVSGSPAPGIVKGDPFLYEDFTPEQLEALRGPQGEPGPLTFADFTPEQIEIIRGPQGDKGDKGDKGDQGIPGDVTQLRGEITTEIAALVDGAPEDLDTLREIAAYAEANRGITDQLNAAISGKADKDHTHSQGNITGLSTALSGKSDKAHTHVSADITDATASVTADRVVKRNRSGDFSVNEPVYDSYPANKGYVDALKDSIDGQGASIIPFNSMTGRQRWADGLTETIDAESPTGRYYSNGSGWSQGRNYFFEVDPGVKYYASMWVKADKPGSRIYIEMRDQNGNHAILKNSFSGGTYILGNYELPTEWTLLETQDMEFKPGVHRANINTLYFNHSNGTERDAVQMLTDIQLIPLAPHTHTSADVTDATERLGRVSDYDTAGKLVRTNADGQLTVYTSSVTEDSSVANKNYVDIEVGKKANTSHTHTQAQVTGLSTALNGKADKSHTHTTSDITDFATEMGKKANSSHTHSQSQITGLSTALNGKANATHTHTTSDITDFATEMGKKANSSHTHTQGEVTGLTAALNGKANKSHAHASSDINDAVSKSLGYGTGTSGRLVAWGSGGEIRRTNSAARPPADEDCLVPRGYVDSRPALFSGVGAPPSSISGAVVGDFWLDTSTMELHKITGV